MKCISIVDARYVKDYQIFRGAVEIVEYSGAMVKGDLILKGKCGTCGRNVARLVEGS